VSVARIAMQHGVNANLLRVWIAKAQKQNDIDTPSAFFHARRSSELTAGHGTTFQAKFWKSQLADLLQTAPRLGK
jgi:transposase-like protein